MSATGKPAKRLFFALWPDAETRAELWRESRELTRGTGRLVAPEMLHLTLAFLHNVPLARLSCVEAAAARASSQPFSLRLDRVGFWPRARLLWLGASRPPAELPRLASSLWDELADCGFTPERRPFVAHVTLARKAQDPQRREPGAAIDWRARRFALIESITGQNRPRYEVLSTWSLEDKAST